MSTSATCIAVRQSLDRRNSSQKTRVHIPKSGLAPFFYFTLHLSSLSVQRLPLSLSVFLLSASLFGILSPVLLFCRIHSRFFLTASLFIFLPFSCRSFCRLSLLECDTVFTSNFSVVSEEVTASRQGSTRQQAPPKRR